MNVPASAAGSNYWLTIPFFSLISPSLSLFFFYSMSFSSPDFILHPKSVPCSGLSGLSCIFNRHAVWLLVTCLGTGTDVHTGLRRDTRIRGQRVHLPPSLQWSPSVCGTGSRWLTSPMQIMFPPRKAQFVSCCTPPSWIRCLWEFETKRKREFWSLHGNSGWAIQVGGIYS